MVEDTEEAVVEEILKDVVIKLDQVDLFTHLRLYILTFYSCISNSKSCELIPIIHLIDNQLCKHDEHANVQFTFMLTLNNNLLVDIYLIFTTENKVKQTCMINFI